MEISFNSVIPILRIFDIAKADEFYLGFLGFSVLQAHTERSSSWTDQSCGQAA